LFKNIGLTVSSPEELEDSLNGNAFTPQRRPAVAKVRVNGDSIINQVVVSHGGVHRVKKRETTHGL